ncbi:MAG: Gfo/Idh/MocA family protein [Saccharofermentanales bacterium]
MKIKIGVLGLADIAFNRFVPSLLKSDRFQLAGVAKFKGENIERAQRFEEKFQAKVYDDFDAMINDSEIDAIYLPVPPAKHYEWAVKCLEAGKHVLVEKPFTTSLNDSQNLIALARQKDLAVHENYMFEFHSQIKQIRQWIETKEYGEVRMMRAAFGFPLRASNDFRYIKSLGGGALLDAGGYVIKLGTILLQNPSIATSETRLLPDFEVDMLGSASLTDENGMVYQAGWGMSNFYQCSLELWTEKYKISTNRIFTSPADFRPTYIIESQNEKQEIVLPSDDHFLNSLEHFADLVSEKELRENREKKILKQAELIEIIKQNG